jgi:hypothetical protein
MVYTQRGAKLRPGGHVRGGFLTHGGVDSHFVKQHLGEALGAHGRKDFIRRGVDSHLGSIWERR